MNNEWTSASDKILEYMHMGTNRPIEKILDKIENYKPITENNKSIFSKMFNRDKNKNSDSLLYDIKIHEKTESNSIKRAVCSESIVLINQDDKTASKILNFLREISLYGKDIQIIFDSSSVIITPNSPINIDFSSIFGRKQIDLWGPDFANTIIDGTFNLKNVNTPIIQGVFAKSMSFHNCNIRKIVIPKMVPALNTLQKNKYDSMISIMDNAGHYPGSFFVRNCSELRNIEGTPLAINIRISNCPNLSGVLSLRENATLEIDDISKKNLEIVYY